MKNLSYFINIIVILILGIVLISYSADSNNLDTYKDYYVKTISYENALNSYNEFKSFKKDEIEILKSQEYYNLKKAEENLDKAKLAVKRIHSYH